MIRKQCGEVTAGGQEYGPHSAEFRPFGNRRAGAGETGSGGLKAAVHTLIA